MKRNRYVDLHRPTKTVNYELAEKNTALAGIKGGPPPSFGPVAL